MTVDIATISVPRLALAFIPVAVVVGLMWHWSHGHGRALYAIARMLLQLTLIGYVLIYIFETESGLLISAVLAVMVIAASWIALNTVDIPKAPLFASSLIAILIGNGSTLVLITQGVLNSFLAVGLISLPGMMTGQILSGVSPLIATRYQIMVMCMIFGAAGLSTVVFLALIRRNRSLSAAAPV